MLNRFSISDPNYNCEEVSPSDGLTLIRFKTEKRGQPQKVEVSFRLSSRGAFSCWSPTSTYCNALMPEWNPIKADSKTASGAPVLSVMGQDDSNKVTIAVSDASTPITIKVGLVEETSEILCIIEFFTMPVGNLDGYEAVIRVDTGKKPYYLAIEETVAWWSGECGYKSAYVPKEAARPMYSTWYSFHQHVDTKEIEKQCALAKKLGMDSVIVDDGWQTDNNSRGYAYCGDWVPTPSKVPDMSAFVKSVHDLDMKFILWYSVPFVGIYSDNYQKFKDEILINERDVIVLDPRYPLVREFLTGLYTKAAKDWKLDGFKLDFIDSFKLQNTEVTEGMDIPVLETAISSLLEEITTALRAINPEILIEFRQSYIGPAIKKYGNMLRAADCPNDALTNRIRTLDVRMTAGETPVHSDMLMWNYDAPVWEAAGQIINVLFSVPQVSVLIDKLSPEHYRMLEFYLDFWNKNKETLLHGKLIPKHPYACYTSVTAVGDKKITVCYSENIVGLSDVIINGTSETGFVIKSDRKALINIITCMGKEVYEKEIIPGLNIVEIPLGGMLVTKEE